MKDTNQTLTMPAIAWHVLTILLNQAGWATTPKEIYVTGCLLESDKMKLPKAPEPDKAGKIDKAKDEAWSKKPFTVALMAKEIEVCMKCLKKAIEGAQFGPGKASKALVETFLAEEC